MWRSPLFMVPRLRCSAQPQDILLSEDQSSLRPVSFTSGRRVSCRHLSAGPSPKATSLFLGIAEPGRILLVPIFLPRKAGRWNLESVGVRPAATSFPPRVPSVKVSPPSPPSPPPPALEPVTQRYRQCRQPGRRPPVPWYVPGGSGEAGPQWHCVLCLFFCCFLTSLCELSRHRSEQMTPRWFSLCDLDDSC